MSRNRLLQSVFAMFVAFGVLGGSALPAGAATWYTHDRWCGTFFTQPCDVQYTGGYPTGYVRAAGTMSQYEVSLQSQTVIGGPWLTVARTYPHSSGTIYTPSVRAGKTSSYRGCVRTVSGGPNLCLAPTGPIYLGD